MRMLVLSRKPGEKIVIGEDITVTVVKTRGNRVWLSFDAPDAVVILRHELAGLLDSPVPGHELPDPDLEGKPAEWTDASPPLVLAR
jgi:carbon storage regulator